MDGLPAADAASVSTRPARPTLLISDLHLCAARPDMAALFEVFLAGPALRAERLYILGDLFDYWAGDDDLDDSFNRRIVSALAECGRQLPVFFMHGNRDFLIGPEFARRARVTLVSDPLLADIGGQATLLMHGDALCTDDLDYQRFRSEVRSPLWIRNFLATPLASRKASIQALRERSEAQKRIKSEAIMDVNAAAVTEAYRHHGCVRLIHGHTHRPAHHEYAGDGTRWERWVLSDWYESGSYLSCDASGCTPMALA